MNIASPNGMFESDSWVLDFLSAGLKIHNTLYVCTLESGIDVATWINVASGKFDKKNKQHSPFKCANLSSKT